MPDLPWTSRGRLDPGGQYLVLASLLPLRKVRSTLRFVRAASAVRKQLADAEGLVGYTLRAKPLAGDYWTLSVWADQNALRRFMGTLPHREVMSSLKPVIGATKFVEWEISATDGFPSWSEALERLASP